MPIIKEITSTETFLVRHPVLRAGKPIESCQFEGDDLPSTKHFGIFTEENLVGVISIFKNNQPLFKNNEAFQIRGMAVLDNFQKKGLGKKLVNYCENYSKKQKNNLIWFNARKMAVGFYEKLGYKIIGEAFEIYDVGTHYMMFKKLRD
jgi:ribosomal protein S18 acetylase RimI-like enzyme